MMRTWRSLWLVALICEAALGCTPPPPAAAPGHTSEARLEHQARHRRRTIGARRYDVLRVAPSRLSLHWRDGLGRPLETFDRLEAALPSPPLAVVNGGIYEPGLTPSGLHIQDGQLLRPLNVDRGRGNFYMQPNAVFTIAGQHADIVTTGRYATTTPASAPRLALQSGPLLVRDGRINPAIDPSWTRRMARNGVAVNCGARRDEVLLLCTSPDETKGATMYEFAAAFVALDCAQALYLDGAISQMRIAGIDDTRRPSRRFAAMLAVDAER